MKKLNIWREKFLMEKTETKLDIEKIALPDTKDRLLCVFRQRL